MTLYPYQTKRAADQELRTWEGTVRGRDRTAMTLRTFKYQSIKLYNSIPVAFRNYSQDQFKVAAKKWSKDNVA